MEYLMYDDFELIESIEELTDEFQNISVLEEYNNTINELLDLKFSIETHGVTPSCMYFANNNNVLSNSISSIAAMESYGFNSINPNMTTAALEGISDKVKELTATWFHKMWNFITNIGTGLSKFYKSAYEKIKVISLYSKDKVFDFLRTVKTQITTHPIIATTAAVAFLIAVAPFIQGLVTGEFPTTREEYLKWYTDISSKVAKFISDKYKNFTGKKTGTPQDIGYTKENINDIEKNTEQALRQNGFVQNIDKSLDEVKNKAESNKNKDPSVFSWIRKSITYLLSKIKELLSGVMKATRNIIDTFIDITKGVKSDIVKGDSFVFKAQALDNMSEDHYGVNNETITNSASIFPREITRIIHQIAMSGKLIFKSKHVEIFSLGKKLLIEIIGNEKDVAGRSAPIICICNSNMSSSEIASKISDFAKSIGRTVNENLIKEAFDKK